MARPSHEEPKTQLLGDFVFSRTRFSNLDSVFSEFSKEDFLKLSDRQRFRVVNQKLLQLIVDAPHASFLLSAVLEYIEKVNKSKILHDIYHISIFEFWLNHFSELNDQENYLVRGKIAGKYIPRDEYQAFFPIGMDKTFTGTHFIAAHLSPDVDTMVASFWGWVDAFAARVGNGRHLWSLPGGPPVSPVTESFYDFFGASVFNDAAISAMTLTLSAVDLVTQKGFLKKKSDTTISSLDLSSNEKAIILVDDKGLYKGDWHRSDVDPIRQIIIRFKSCLRWFENNLHVKLISFFAKEKLHVKDIPEFISSVFDVSISDCEPVKEFNERQLKDLDLFFLKVLGLPKGIHSNFGELIHTQTKLSMKELSQIQKELESLDQSGLFDASGYLIEDRPAIFNRFEKIIHQLDNAIHYTRDYAEQLGLAIDIKTKVLDILPQFVTLRSNIDDIRIKMQNQEYLTVVIPQGDDMFFPIGVIWASAIQKPILGTVTFRDFCNQDEIKMSSYLAPISVIDHHKVSLKTSMPPMAIIGDAQSCNVLIAELAFKINSKYSLGGMSSTEVEEEIQKLHLIPLTTSNTRKMQDLLHRRIAGEISGGYFIHPLREIAEYLCFLNAILDDTDLLTKVSKRDVECVAELLNRIKSLTTKNSAEVINFDDISRDKNFANAAAKRILRNPEMYSLYRKVYESKEKEVEKNLNACIENRCESLFADTKEQNGCCRVGQSKLFTINFPTYLKHADKFRKYWISTAKAVVQEHPEIDLHIHMISTIASADEVYQDKVGHYKHFDELWFWVPSTQKAYDHLSSFLTAFQSAHKLGEGAYIEFFDHDEDFEQVFKQCCKSIPTRKVDGDMSLAVLHFGAGLINSRKAMISPYLPKIIT